MADQNRVIGQAGSEWEGKTSGNRDNGTVHSVNGATPSSPFFLNVKGVGALPRCRRYSPNTTGASALTRLMVFHAEWTPRVREWSVDFEFVVADRVQDRQLPGMQSNRSFTRLIP